MARNQINIGIALMALFIMLTGRVIFAQEAAPESKPAPAPAPILKMSASTPKADVTVGDMIEVDLAITNMAATDTEIVKPMIDIDSLTFAIRITPITGAEQPIDFVFSRIVPSVYEHGRSKMERVTLGTSGTPQAEYKTSFTLPAVSIGNWQITSYFQGGPAFLIAAPLNVRVIGPKNELRGGELLANIATSTGTMTCKFYFRDAPNTVMNFVKFAKEGSYNNLTFHRIIKDFMIQGGDPKGDGTGGPGYSIKSEFNHHPHLKGVLAMARSDSNDSAGSQFYICLAARPDLDGKYTTFGELTSGTEVLEAIGNVTTTGNNGTPPDRPLEAVVIKSITVQYKE